MAAYVSVVDGMPSAVTLISDSKITWTDSEDCVIKEYDHSQKLFCLSKSATMFGYCGDSLFSLAVLSQISAALDLSQRFIQSESILEKVRIIEELLNAAASKYPKPEDLKDTRVIQISRVDADFYAYEFNYNKTLSTFSSNSVALGLAKESCFVKAWGTGRKHFEIISRCMELRNGNFARNYFRSMVLLIKHQKDRKSGGVPQMTTLTRDRLAEPVGVYYEGTSYVMGLPYTAGKPLQHVVFRNEAYEVVNTNGVRRSGSQKHVYIDWKPDA